LLYDNEDLIEAISNALNDDGIFIIQQGESDRLDDTHSEMTKFTVLETAFVPYLVKHGFESIKEYEEAHGGYVDLWAYLVAFKDASKSLKNWYADEAKVELAIRERILPTKSGESSLRYFDGAEMQTYARTSRAMEEVHCRRMLRPPFCDRGHGFSPEKSNVSGKDLELKTTRAGGRMLLFKRDVPAGSYLAIDDAIHWVLLPPDSVQILLDGKLHNISGSAATWATVLSQYGSATRFFGNYSPAYAIRLPSGPTTFVGFFPPANRTPSIREAEIIASDPGRMATTRAIRDASKLSLPPPAVVLHDDAQPESSVVNTFLDRNYLVYAFGTTYQLARDIRAGEAVLLLPFDNEDDDDISTIGSAATVFKLA